MGLAIYMLNLGSTLMIESVDANFAFYWCYQIWGTRSRYFRQGYAIESHRILHDDVIKWKHFTRYWPFVRGIHQSPVKSPHKGQWRGALMFSLIYVWINGWVNNREAGDLRRYPAHYDVTVMVGCNYLLIPEIPAFGTKVLIGRYATIDYKFDTMTTLI